MPLTRARQFINEATVEADGSSEVSQDINILDELVSFTMPTVEVNVATVPTGSHHDQRLPARHVPMDATIVLASHRPVLNRRGKTYDYTFVEDKNASYIPSGDTGAVGTVTHQMIGRLIKVDPGAMAQTGEVGNDTLTFLVDYYRKDDSSQATAECEFDTRTNPQKFEENGVSIYA